MKLTLINVIALICCGISSPLQNASDRPNLVYVVGPTIISDTSGIRPTTGWRSFNSILASVRSEVSPRDGCSLSFEVSFTKGGTIGSVRQYTECEDTTFARVVLKALNASPWILPNDGSRRQGFDVIIAPRARCAVVVEAGLSLLSIHQPGDTALKPVKRYIRLSSDSSYLFSTVELGDSHQPRPQIGWDSLARTMVFPEAARSSGFQASILVTGECDSTGYLHRVRMQPYYPMFERVEWMLKFVHWLPATIRGRPANGSFVLPMVFAFKDRPRYRFLIVLDE